MRIIPVFFLSLLGLLSAVATAAEAVDAELFPAEFLFKQREALGISDAQIQAIGETMKQAQPLFEEGKRQLDEAASALQKILQEDHPDEKQADEKMHTVLDCEGDIKMLQLHTLLAVRAQLSPEQLGKARQLRDQLIARNAAEASQHERVEKKLDQLRSAIKARSVGGEVAADVVARAKGIYELLSAGKEADAEKQIDDLLSKFGEEKTNP